jgi:hypothetical protein
MLNKNKITNFHLHRPREYSYDYSQTNRNFNSTSLNFSGSLRNFNVNNNLNVNTIKPISHSGKFHSDNKFPLNEVLLLDFKEILVSQNFTQVEQLMESLVFTKFKSENESLVKTISQFQKILEFLFKIQTDIMEENNLIENDYNLILLKEKDNLDKQLNDNKLIIECNKAKQKELKVNLKLYNRQLNTTTEYLNYRDNGKHTEFYYCNICEDKKFSNYERLHAHYVRRHLKEDKYFNANATSPTVKRNDEDGLDKIKNELMSTFENFHKTNFTNLLNNQQNLERKIEEMRLSSTNDQLLEELKKFKNEFQVGQSTLKVSDNSSEAEAIQLYKSEAEKMNKILEGIRYSQDLKLEKINEHLDHFKTEIKREIEDLKKHPVSDVKNNKINPPPIKINNSFQKIGVSNVSFEIVPNERVINVNFHEDPLPAIEQPRENTQRSIQSDNIKIQEEVNISRKESEGAKVSEPPQVVINSDQNTNLVEICKLYNDRDTNVLLTDVSIGDNYKAYSALDYSLNEQKFRERINSSLQTILKDTLPNDQMITFEKIDSLPSKESYAKLINKLFSHSVLSSNKDSYYAHYMENALTMLKVKQSLAGKNYSYLPDNILNQIFQKLNLKQIFNHSGYVEDELKKNDDPILNIDSRGTAQFNIN